MRLRRLAACAAACLLAAAIPLTVAVMQAQEREDRTLLSSEQMRAIINEASGERAMHHLLELVPYQRVRHASEYGGILRERTRSRPPSPREGRPVRWMNSWNISECCDSSITSWYA